MCIRDRISSDKLISSILLILISVSVPFALAANVHPPIQFSFYQQPIELHIQEPIPDLSAPKLNEQSIKSYYSQLKSDVFQGLLSQLHAYKRALNLNDWLFYELMHKSLEACYPGLGTNQNELISWYLLNESGYQTRLSYLRNKIWVYCYTDEEMFEVSMIQDNQMLFVNLSESRRNEKQFEQEVYLLDFNPSKGKKSFSFKLHELPNFKAKLNEVRFDFTYFKQEFNFSFDIDMALIQLMKDYPFISEQDYLKVPFSKAVMESLIPPVSYTHLTLPTILLV